MQSDEEQIRKLVSTWLAASQSGDVDTILGLMTDDVVFLRPGCSPMSKQEFAAASRAAAGAMAPRIEGTSEIQEIQVAGDFACMWTRMSVRVTPPGAKLPQERAGHTLSVLRKDGGKWLLARDANLLTPVPKSKSCGETGEA